MDHTAGTYVLDAAGPGAAVRALRQRAEALRHDLKLLLDENPA